MAKWSVATAVALMVSAAAAQDKDETKDLLKSSLQASTKAGGFRIEGRVEQDNGMGGFKIGGFGEGGLEGKFTGVAANGMISIKLETSKGTYELFKKGDKVVQRQTWTGKQDMVGSFSHEITAILGLTTLLKQIEKVKNIRDGEAKAVGGVDCKSVKAQLPTGYVADEEEEDAGTPMNMKMFELKKVEATIYIGRDDKLVHRLDVTLSKGFSKMIRVGGLGGGDDEEKDKKKGDKGEKGDDGDDDEDDGGMVPGMKSFKMKSSYSVTLGYDKDVKVEIPEDVRKYLGE